MTQVGAARFGNGVEVDVDDVVEHPHGGRHRALQPRVIDDPLSVTWLSRLTEPEIADGDLVVRGIERDLGAEVGRVDHADMPLRRAQIAGVLEGDPGMAGLEQHGQHPAPQVGGADRFQIFISPRCAFRSYAS